MALTNAERQARYVTGGAAGRPASPGPGTADQYREWRDALPESLAGSATAELLEQVCDLDLSVLEAVELPGASGVTARPPATASPWRPRRGSRAPVSGGR